VTRRLVISLCVVAALASAQQQSAPPNSGPVSPPASATAGQTDVLAVNDQIAISATDVEGMSDRPFRIEPDGTVTLPLIGKMRAEGLTLDQFRKDLLERLAVYVKTPRVSVAVLAERRDTIVVSGSFKNPGIHPLPARRSLLDVVSSVGGLQSNSAKIRITRRIERGKIPLPSATMDAEGRFSAVVINFTRLVGNPGSPEDIGIVAEDILSTDPPGTVYLTGEVMKSGPFQLDNRESIGVTELISMAGGFNREAAPSRAKVLRTILNGSKRAEIPVDVASILDGRSFDFPVQDSDIVVIPRAKGKGAAAKTALKYVVPGLVSTVIYVAVRR
jgi:polysaccharide biosynthesis/export protein